MKVPPAVEKLAARFDALSVRERVLTAAAALAAVLMLWSLAVLDPISAKRAALLAEQSALQDQISAAQTAMEVAAATDPVTLALAKEKTLQAALDEINHELASQSAGLIPPERMVQVIKDVLNSQRGVRLVSLHNRSVRSLAQDVEFPPAATAPAPVATEISESGEPGEETPPADTEAAPVVEEKHEMTGPFVHPVEIVVEGSYLDVLAYLRALESLDWRFYWKVLELDTIEYPTNRVRIELSTLSMEKDWIGV